MEDCTGIGVLQHKVEDAVARFIDEDSLLLELNAHEQTIAHRIAVYLECLFDSDLNVDCEYNKHLEQSKRISLDIDLKRHRKQFESCGCLGCSSVLQGVNIDKKLFRPDIVVHSRGNDRSNLIAIEIKKTAFCPFDAAKLDALTVPKEQNGEYGYILGVFLFFKDVPEIIWFSNRRPMSPL